jgi:hypothetical protein
LLLKIVDEILLFFLNLGVDEGSGTVECLDEGVVDFVTFSVELTDDRIRLLL